MARYLVVANQTLGGTELDAAIRDRIAVGESDFYVVVPMVPPEFESDVCVSPDPVFGIATATSATPEAMDEARERSEQRLELMIGRIEEAGGSASGEVGSSEPFDAVRSVLDRETFDEVLISTLPAGLSRWLKMDLPSRVARIAEVPVVTVEAQA
jgi:nucleotide-binding universal stress UspA family protein